MTQALLLNGRPASVAGRNISMRQLLGQPRWSNMGVAWTHSWDIADAILYTPSAGEQSEFGISSAPRVGQVPDPSGNKPLLRDPGVYGQTYGTTLGLPGPQYIATSARFRRPAILGDLVHTSPNLYSMLSPQTTIFNSSDYFLPPNGFTPPYWGAFLCRAASLPAGVIDSLLGSDPLISAGPTIGRGTQLGAGTDWSFACWFDGGRTVNDMVTNGTTTITSATAAFVAGDVGKVVVGTNLPSSSPYATIASLTNGTTVVLSVAASGSGSSLPLTISTGLINPDGVVRSGHDQSVDETVLIICSMAEGALQSTMYVYWRDANRVVQLGVGAGTVSVAAQQMAWRELFAGWQGQIPYLTAMGICDAGLTAPDVAALLAWAQPWLVPSGSLPAEP